MFCAKKEETSSKISMGFEKNKELSIGTGIKTEIA
jgi:hypothetical protein